jgi:hypothetical protein
VEWPQRGSPGFVGRAPLRRDDPREERDP